MGEAVLCIATRRKRNNLKSVKWLENSVNYFLAFLLDIGGIKFL